MFIYTHAMYVQVYASVSLYVEKWCVGSHWSGRLSTVPAASSSGVESSRLLIGIHSFVPFCTVDVSV